MLTATIEEFTLIRDYILMPHMLTMVQRSIEEIETSGNVMRRLYANASHVIMNRMTADMVEVRRKLKKAGIRVGDPDQDDFVTNYPFTCRGYTDNFGITREAMRTEISLRMTAYISELSERMNQRD